MDSIIELVDIKGQVVYRFNSFVKHGRLTHQIDVKEFAKGVYYVRVNIDSHVKVEKLVVQ